MKYKVYISGYKDKDYLGEYNSQEECWIAMFNFMEKIKFKSYYQRRIRRSDTETTIDFGSHTVFLSVFSENPVEPNEFSICSAPENIIPINIMN